MLGLGVSLVLRGRIGYSTLGWSLSNIKEQAFTFSLQVLCRFTLSNGLSGLCIHGNGCFLQGMFFCGFVWAVFFAAKMLLRCCILAVPLASFKLH